MFISIRKKILHILMVMSVLTILIVIFSTTDMITTDIKSKIGLDYFEEIGAKLFNSETGASMDPESVFYEKVARLREEKLSVDNEDKFYLLNTEIKDTNLNIPSYYSEDDKPIIQPFDVRFTLGIYYHSIRLALENEPDKIPQLPFHWYDWTDLSSLNQYLLAKQDQKPTCDILDPREKEEIKKGEPTKDKDSLMNPYDTCYEDSEIPSDFQHGNKVLPGFNVFKSSIGKTTPEKAILYGKSYLYSFMPGPSMILFLTGSGSYNITTGERSKLLDSGMVESYITSKKSLTVDAMVEFNDLKNKVRPNTRSVIKSHEMHIPPESFIYDTNSIINDFKSKIENGDISPVERKYYDSLLYSENEIKNGGPPKYFAEARLVKTLMGDHYDWRFFNGIIQGSFEQTLTLHRLIRTWLSFTRKNGIASWVAHGSLLSWYWNGMAFPWDNDIDVQVPVMDLHKLSLNFNQTLVIEDTEDGYGRYFLDCGSFITLRAKGNGNNNIDARFIDVDTGLYIDITGLAVSDTKPLDRYTKALPAEWKIEDNFYNTNLKLRTYNCRNNHFSQFEEISPLIRSTVEGEIGYIPKAFNSMLTREYSKGMLSKKFSGHVFVNQLRLWIKERDLYQYLKDKKVWIEKYSSTHNTESEVKDSEDSLSEPEKIDLKNILDKNAGKSKKSMRSENSIFIREEKEKEEIQEHDIQAISNFSDEDLIGFLQNDDIFMNFVRSYKFTAFHQEEMMRFLVGKSTYPQMSQFPGFRPLLYDPFAYYISNNHISYDEEVKKYLDLQEEYL